MQVREVIEVATQSRGVNPWDRDCGSLVTGKKL